MASSKKRLPAELSATLAESLRSHLRPGRRLLLGLSGGLDSCVLLNLLAGLRDAHGFELQALHVNHGISPNADLWSEFCADRCRSLQVPFQSVKVAVPRDSGLGIEAAARFARYRAFADHPADCIVLAHHRNDQAETLLLQLLRGAGVKGLAAMGAESEMVIDECRHTLLRPLLEVSRRQLEAYASAHGMSWIEDESNLDLAYDRNFIRHQVMPALQQRFPSAAATLARSAAHLAEADELLDEIAAQDAERWVHAGRLQVAALNALSVARGRNLLRFWLGLHLPEPPSARRLHEVYRQLSQAGSEAQVRVALEGGAVHRYRGEAWLVNPAAPPAPAALSWQGQAEWRVAGGCLRFTRSDRGGGLALQPLQGALLNLQPRYGGERFKPDCRRPTRSLRHWFQELGIPAWQRPTLPLLYLGEELAWVAGIGVACRLQSAPGEAGLEISWQPDAAAP